jgi:hypothetical protein
MGGLRKCLGRCKKSSSFLGFYWWAAKWMQNSKVFTKFVHDKILYLQNEMKEVKCKTKAEFWPMAYGKVSMR